MKLNLDKFVSTKLIFVTDILLSVFATFLANILVRVMFNEPGLTTVRAFWMLVGSGVFSALAFIALGTFRIIIRHASLRDAAKFFVAAALKDVFLVGYGLALPYIFKEVPHVSSTATCTGLMFDYMFSLFLLLGLRLFLIVSYDFIKARVRNSSNCKSVLVYGTGDKSIAMIQRLQNSPHYKINGFLVFGRSKSDYPLYGFVNADDIKYLHSHADVDGILFTSNADAQGESDRLVKYCTESGVQLLVAPPIDEIGGRTARTSVHEIKIEDLLGRDEIKISMKEIRENFCGKTVMVTGAAGSIGSELCRQLATFGVKELVLFDNAETPMHNFRLELEDRFPDLKFTPVIGDVRLQERLDYVFRKYHPQVVFHAAAYKHVPLMEENPCEAVLVNVGGSRNVADKCLEYDVEKMVMISTDKAVNPTNIMGCTKRLAEIYVQSLGLAIERGERQGKTKFVTTRFGNVLGSNGSVIPRFKEQIAKGGPVTVTHPDIMRFFMTIPEACRLVMEAATMSTGNQIVVFDMGSPVKIADLAKRMIELAGFIPDEDIKIEYTGLRPGEKLYEEVLSNTENTLPTSHDRIPEMVKLMKTTVPEYKSNNSVFEKFDK